MGALGFFGKRRGARPVPLRAALRDSARTDPTRRMITSRLFPGAPVLDLRRFRASIGERLTAFAPGCVSPTRPMGGAGARYSATASGHHRETSSGYALERSYCRTTCKVGRIDARVKPVCGLCAGDLRLWSGGNVASFD